MANFTSEYMRNNEWQPGTTFEVLTAAKLKTVRMTAQRIGAQGFRIVRASDGVALMQSKQPPAPQVSVDPAGAPVASEPVIQLPFSLPLHHRNALNDLANGNMTIWNDGTNASIFANLVNHGFAEAVTKYEASTVYQVTPAGLTFLNPAPVADSSLPFASFDEDSDPVGESLTTEQKLVKIIFGEASPQFVDATSTPKKPTKPSHGRTSRNRNKAPKTANSRDNGVVDLNRPKNALGRHNVQKRQHVAVTMEHKTDIAKNWRKRRNLANATAMPQPSITGMGLLRQAQLTVVEKPRQLTRVLETRAA